MAFLTIPDSWIEVGKALVQRLFQRIKDNLDTLNGTVGTLQGGDILNGFFEIVVDIAVSPLRPLNWDVLEYLGGTVELDDTNSRKGKYALKFNHPGGGGNGGGEAESDYYAVNPLLPEMIAAVFWTTIAGVRITVTVDYFDEDKIFIIASTETLYDENSGNPTSATDFLFAMVPPSTARYMKVKFIMGDTDTDPGASTDIFLDAVRMIHDPAFAAGDIGVSNLKDGNTSSGSFTPLAEWILHKPGTLRVKYTLLHGPTGVGGPGNARSQITQNGVLVAGTSVTTETFVNVSVDLSGWSRGDVIAIELRENAGVDGAYMQDAQLFSTRETGTYDLIP